MENTLHIPFSSHNRISKTKYPWHIEKGMSERSSKYEYALGEAYEKVLTVPHECGAFRIVFQDGKEEFHWHGRENMLSTLAKHKENGAIVIDIIHTHPLSHEDLYKREDISPEKAARKILFMNPEDVRPMPPTLSDFYTEICIEHALHVPVHHKVIDAHTLWHYDFDMTSEFIQRVLELIRRGGEEEVEHNHFRLEHQFPEFVKARAAHDAFAFDHYKNSPEKYLQDYIAACRMLGISIHGESASEFK